MKGKVFKRTIGILMLFALVFSMVGVYDGGKTAKAADAVYETGFYWHGTLTNSDDQYTINTTSYSGIEDAGANSYSPAFKIDLSSFTSPILRADGDELNCIGKVYNEINDSNPYWKTFKDGDNVEYEYTEAIPYASGTGYTYDLSTVKANDSDGIIYLCVTGEITPTDLYVYEKPSTDVWIQNSTTSYSYVATESGGNSAALAIPVSDLTSGDTSTITSLSFTSSFASTGYIGYNNAAGTWVQASDIKEGTNTIETEGIKSGTTIYIYAYWFNAGTTNTISDIKVTVSGTGDYIPGQLYTHSTSVSDGKYSQRWVYLVSADDLASIKNATFTITRASDSKKMTKSVTSAYKSIKADGETLSYDGYYWVCYSLTGIPEGVTLTGAIELN